MSIVIDVGRAPDSVDDTEYGFDTVAEVYESSRRLSICPADKLIDVIQELGVPLDRVVDFGAGTGYWLREMQAKGVAKTAWGVDISAPMLRKAKNSGAKAAWVHGSLTALEKADIAGAQCLFSAMTLHLMPFPGAIQRLVRCAARKKIPYVVVVENVSAFYYVAWGHREYLELLPPGLARVWRQYRELLDEHGIKLPPPAAGAPYPMPMMSLDAWRSIGLNLAGYRFVCPSDIGWSWQIAPEEVVEELDERRYSVFFKHGRFEAKRLARQLQQRLEGRDDFAKKAEVPYWFHLHIFEVEQNM